MKLKYIFTMFVAVILFLWMPQLKAQIDGHNYTVQWDDGTGQPKVNALYDAVMGDTASDGTRADPDRVYILLKGGVYWNTEHFQNQGYALRFVGQTPDPTDVFGNPPTLQMVARGDGSVDGHILSGYGDVYMKNLYIIGSDQNGVQTYYQPMEFDGDNLHCVFDSVIFERSNFAITAWTSKHNSIYFTNCKWLNLVERPITQQWTGRAVSVWADIDTLVFDNCTFQNVGAFVVQVEGGSAKYFRFVHNTLINIGRQPFQGGWWQEAYIANNLYINPFFDGEGYNDFNPVGNPNRNAYTTGLFGINTLPSSYGPDLGRRIVFANSAAFLAQTFRTAWDDTVRIQPYANSVTDSFFNTYSIANGGQMVIKDTAWINQVPNFTAFDTSNYPTMIQFIKNLRAGITPAPIWMQNLQVEGSDTLWTAPQWPLAQNFTYTDANLMTGGTDGLPLGDLNWFPDKLADWNTNKTQYLQQIKNLAGAEVVYDVKDEQQAEDGTVGGTASVLDAQGTKYYHMSGGFIEWTFDIATAGQYDINVLIDLNGRATSGVNFFVNGNEIHDPRGWGQYVFGNDASSVYPTFPSHGLNWWLIKQDQTIEFTRDGHAYLNLPAGSNTVQIKASWCDNYFGGIQILEAGTSNVVKDLGAQDVTNYSIASPGIQGAPWTPLWFKSVALGSNGSVTVNLNAPTDGDYLIQAFYQNYSGESTGNVSVDGNVVGSFHFASNTDSTGLNNLSDAFTLTAGAHQITLSGSNVQVDYLQLIQKVTTGIKDHNILPGSFSLSQNYPNPFNPTTNINFSIAKASNVKLTVYNILGQKVATLINNFMNAGTYTYQFNGVSLASGVYLYSFEAGDFRMNKKMILLK